jgi:hypothetical protein
MSLSLPLDSPLDRPLWFNLETGLIPINGGIGLVPDSGYIFVFHEDGRQLYHADGRAVQVAEIYANA